MDTASVFSDGRSGRDLKKYHEGWVYHQAANSKSWSKYWMVLRGNMLFIFTSDKTNKQTMVGTLTLNDATEVDRATPDKKKGPYKFELITSSSKGEKRINKFKFDKENDRDLWKSFIIGITVGIVPRDVHLLPGQLKDVHEAMAEVRNKPPPVPSPADRIPRPRILGQPQFAGQNSGGGVAPGRYDDGMDGTVSFGAEESHMSDDASSGSGSFGSHVTRMHRSQSEGMVTPIFPSGGGVGGGGIGSSSNSGGGTINNLREMTRRQEQLTNRILASTSTTPTSRRPSYPEVYHREEREEEREEEPVISPRGGTLGPSGGADLFPPLPAETVSQDSGFEQERHEDYTLAHNNNSTHLFYLDSERNRESPSWFFDECQRDEAEQLLTVGRKFGNVLMRPSSTFVTTGKYVISMRREVAGGTNLNHYEVVRTADGFKINVDNKHSSMRCLSDVMDFFVSVAGPGTHPLRTNDRSKIYQSTVRLASNNSSPNVMSPKREASNPSFGGFENNIATSPSWAQTQGAATRDSGDRADGGARRQPSTGDGNWSFGPSGTGLTGTGRQDTYLDRDPYGGISSPPAAPPAAPPPPPPPPPGGAGLQIQGNVAGPIAQAVEEMNQSFTPRSQPMASQDVHPVDVHPVQAQPAGGQWHQQEGFNNDPNSQPRWSDREQEEVPGNQQTIYGQRQTTNAYGGDYGSRETPYGGGLNAAVPPRNVPMETIQRQAGQVDDITGGMRRMTTGYDGVPSGPPPPPPGRVTAYGRPSSPTYSNYPSSQPPQVYGRQDSYQQQQQQQQPTGPPAFGMPSGGGAGARSRYNEQPSFENELKNRLVRQREEIYASGAQVLRSNFN